MMRSTKYGIDMVAPMVSRIINTKRYDVCPIVVFVALSFYYFWWQALCFGTDCIERIGTKGTQISPPTDKE
jgi:hypothetical protein